MHETRYRIRSTHLGNERDIWVRPPPAGREPKVLLVFLDAELYRDRVEASPLVEDLEAGAAIPPALVVFVSHGGVEARWIECPCHPPFAAFLQEELIPWLAGIHPAMSRLRERVLIGLSYTGLAASFAVLHPANAFTTVVSQSGSYWWNDLWLAHEYAGRASVPSLRFHLTVGQRETQTHVRHKEDLVQTIAQIDGVRGFRDVLARRGCEVEYREFDGGHEASGWKLTLPDALRWACASR